MADQATSDKHKKQLEILHDYLDQDGWEVMLQPPGDANPYHLVIVKILSDEDYSLVLWNIELSFLPIPEGNLPNLSILQCFVPLADSFDKLLKPELYEMITSLNTKLPLVGFGFFNDINLLFYKHNIMMPNEITAAGGLVLSESLAMISYLVATYSASITATATGRKSVAEAITELKSGGLFS